ncbi:MULTISPECIES: hypothetical protein [unclassified Chelatococcus]|uniref:hypothetical protein n=1 Tax=unclassified Chelatococcus TaxID=2638111 RepID=UPI001BCB4CF7|nr:MULTISPECIES: hypothetical protein [unclassified Chelatococcus]MBS7739375.1 hypothetical protein [Chelatococcus sp. HY11]MBX3546856.1 hypothetical protein [Chelatococcus sp.]MCO5076090.1 hypothetical protein [Chelatococcus sp.]
MRLITDLEKIYSQITTALASMPAHKPKIAETILKASLSLGANPKRCFKIDDPKRVLQF